MITIKVSITQGKKAAAQGEWFQTYRLQCWPRQTWFTSGQCKHNQNKHKHRLKIYKCNTGVIFITIYDTGADGGCNLTPRGPVNMKDFPNLVQQMHQESDRGFEEEFDVPENFFPMSLLLISSLSHHRHWPKSTLVRTTLPSYHKMMSKTDLKTSFRVCQSQFANCLTTLLSPKCVIDDNSRVVLDIIDDDDSSDYINANYIDVSCLK